MSADNWAVCPNCRRNAESKYIQEEVLLEENYGKIPATEYAKLLTQHQANSVQKILGDNTLREDYRIGIDKNGVFTVGYISCCDKCGLTWKYNHSEQAFRSTLP